ncbi:MAG TPA: type II secretion system major pseudopilin GspG [Gemmatimonadaceae bacterium]|nr:type II secretion system major pseudopilin GspG [Gemmatimonadaceae bacterium]
MSCKTERARRAARRRGFTLIELLVTIAIIATLAAIVAPALFGHIGQARTDAVRSQIKVLSLALDGYRLDNDAYPSSEQGLEALRTVPVGGEPPRNWKGPYLRQVLPLDPWDRPYVYVAPGLVNRDSYDLYSLGKDGRPGGTGENQDLTSWGGVVTQ